MSGRDGAFRRNTVTLLVQSWVGSGRIVRKSAQQVARVRYGESEPPRDARGPEEFGMLARRAAVIGIATLLATAGQLMDGNFPDQVVR